MARLLRHRLAKAADTDRPILPPPRHIPTLPESEVSGDPQEGPHLRAEQTKSGEKRTLPLKGPLSGVQRTYPNQGLNSRL